MVGCRVTERRRNDQRGGGGVRAHTPPGVGPGLSFWCHIWKAEPWALSLLWETKEITQCLLMSLPMAAMTRHHVLMALKPQNCVLSHLEVTLPPKVLVIPENQLWLYLSYLNLFLSVCVSFLLRTTPVLGLGPTPLQHDFTLTTSARTLSPN